ncbi:bifunctional adenosylcobinamide kinase/adenosylcobinamide-phosphate guanylyltransferase [Clostridium sp. Ade.TY]|uniref:bifunctional adenosylcobinamide kinase/adenosylcobinamide-phosphate guanylyltransferase n=1 Tax=Clostridium sp. Ade.TY TaxID=1391647 RepID=UPI0003F8B553|nr:bifunctional adenosylcobinamide kinase/adenosylcobinamide-phosphate guanylyltransferase [Clostridium sp. Ade.TY]
MKIIVIGGTRSGKSFMAEELSKILNGKKSDILYLATMQPFCIEDKERINSHIERRKECNFKTLEVFSDISSIKNKIKLSDTILLDSVTTLLNNEMFKDKVIEKNISKRISKEILEISRLCKNIIIVSDYIFSDSIIYDDLVVNYSRELAYINRGIVKDFDIVIECINNNYIIHKGKAEGENLINEIY